jgi:hypothetical protein
MWYIVKTILAFLRDREYRSLLLATALVLAFGAVVYHYLEGWSWIDALYFCAITLATIGYGDLAPKTDAGKLFTIFYILVGIGLILTFVNTVYDFYRLQRKTEIEKRRKRRAGN